MDPWSSMAGQPSLLNQFQPVRDTTCLGRGGGVEERHPRLTSGLHTHTHRGGGIKGSLADIENPGAVCLATQPLQGVGKETQGLWLEGGFGRVGLRDLAFTLQALTKKPLLFINSTSLYHASLGQLWLCGRSCRAQVCNGYTGTSKRQGTKAGMCACMRACVYICVHACTCVRVCAHMCACMHMCVCACTCASACMHACVYRWVRVHTQGRGQKRS